MGRHSKKGLDYFNLDCNQEDNLNYIEAKHGIVGYGVVVKLWRKIYQIHGYYCDWNEKSVYLFAKEVDVEIQVLNEIVNTCLSEGIFSRKMYEDHSILTSHGTQKRWKKIVVEARRKDVEIEEIYCLLTIPTGKVVFPPGKMVETTEDCTQRKENKIKESFAPPAQGDFKGKKKEEGKEPQWQLYVQTWHDFVQKKFGLAPLFTGEDPRCLKSVVGKLKSRTLQKNRGWDEVSGVAALKRFLEVAFSDKWLANHFVLRNLDSKFEEIERIPAGNALEAPHRDFDAEIKKLIVRFHEGKVVWKDFDPALFDWLSEQKVLQLTTEQWQKLRVQAVEMRIKQLSGSNQAKDLRTLEAYQQSPLNVVSGDEPVLQKTMKKRGLQLYLAKQA